MTNTTPPDPDPIDSPRPQCRRFLHRPADTGLGFHLAGLRQRADRAEPDQVQLPHRDRHPARANRAGGTGSGLWTRGTAVRPGVIDRAQSGRCLLPFLTVLSVGSCRSFLGGQEARGTGGRPGHGHVDGHGQASAEDEPRRPPAPRAAIDPDLVPATRSGRLPPGVFSGSENAAVVDIVRQLG